MVLDAAEWVKILTYCRRHKKNVKLSQKRIFKKQNRLRIHLSSKEACLRVEDFRGEIMNARSIYENQIETLSRI